MITTFAGNGVAGYSGDGGPATSATLDLPYGVGLDGAGNLYIADTNNCRIREVSGGVVTTIAGNGSCGAGGDGGPATGANPFGPTGVALDAASNLYIADSTNCRIRKVSSGTITTAAGSGLCGYSGDGGPATSASLGYATSVALDSAGNLYIATWFNCRVRKVNGGIITTVAGNGSCAYGGDGGQGTSASLNYLDGLPLDNAGDLYIADTGNCRIRKVSGGIIATVAGNGSCSFGGDGGVATNANVNAPYGVAVDAARNLYIADSNNNRVREVTYATSVGTDHLRQVARVDQANRG